MRSWFISSNKYKSILCIHSIHQFQLSKNQHLFSLIFLDSFFLFTVVGKGIDFLQNTYIFPATFLTKCFKGSSLSLRNVENPWLAFKLLENHPDLASPLGSASSLPLEMPSWPIAISLLETSALLSLWLMNLSTFSLASYPLHYTRCHSLFRWSSNQSLCLCSVSSFFHEYIILSIACAADEFLTQNRLLENNSTLLSSLASRVTFSEWRKGSKHWHRGTRR